jgi:SAM-dependent methyltransferase
MMNPAEFANIAQSERRFWWYRGMREILFRVLEPHVRGRRFERMLEAGCGTGYLSHLLQEERNWPVVPMDIGWEGIAYARGMGTRNPVQADIRFLPFDEGAFDVVFSMDVIVHLPPGEELAAFREMARVLKPGGLLVLRAAALDVLRSRHSVFVHERQRFTRGRLMSLAAAAGLRARRCTYLNTLLLPVAALKFRVWEPLTGARPASGTAPVPGWLDRLLYGSLALEARWLAAGLGFPAGQSLLLIAEKI